MINRSSDFVPTQELALENVKTEAEQTAAIPVVAEQLEVGKKVIETGRVNVSKDVNQINEVVDVPLVHEELDVQRVAVNQIVTAPPPPVRYEGDTMIIPILREVAVVEKRLMLVEELRVTKRQIQTVHHEQVALRQESVNVERIDENDIQPPTELNTDFGQKL